MKRLLFLIVISVPLSCMQKTLPPEAELEKVKQIRSLIENNIAHDCIIEWESIFKNIETSDVAHKQAYKHSLLQKVQPFLFNLASRFGHRELLEVIQFQSTDDGKKIITRDESTVITMPEGVPNRIALNANGTALAINYGNTLQIISKKHQWGYNSCERKPRYPMQSLAFGTPQIVTFTTEHAQHSFDTKTKILEPSSKSSYGKNILISHDGRYLFFDVTNNDRISTTIALKDLLTENLQFFDREKCNINGWLFKKFTANAKGNFVAATDSKIIFGQKKDDGYTLIKPTKRDRPPFIEDCDIASSGKQVVAIGDHKFHLYEIGTDNMRTGNTEQALHAVRFHPSDTTILLATDAGIKVLDSETFACRLLLLPSLRALALSDDGDTIAAAGSDAVFILSRKDLKKSLTIPELILIKRLATETSEKVFSETKFIEIFKNIKNRALQQRLVKFFKLNYQTLGYEECGICKDNFADTILHRTHAFCHNCLESWKAEGKNTCPLCRFEIVSEIK